MKAGADKIVHQKQATYLADLEPKRDALFERMEARARERGYPISDPEVATFLGVAVRAAKPKFIVELGTNIGYSAIAMARAAESDARVVSIELDAELAKEARAFIAEAKLPCAVEVREGLATEQLKAIKGDIDFLYLDCVKREYPEYLELAIPRMRSGGVIVADNALWMGLVASDEVPEKERAATEGMRAFNRMIVSHPALQGVVLPLGDGVAYAVKR